MRFLFRLTGWALAIAAILLLIIGGVTYLWLDSSLPETKGTVTVAGLDGPASIARDADGLVHIRADNAKDAYFALGYAHAQDRLWQMEATRRLVAGRLAEIAGKRAVPEDRLMRTLNLYVRAEASLPMLSTETRDALAAYARGVNAWITGHRGALPPEFALAGIAPAPWRPADSLAWGRLMAWRLSGSWRHELVRARIAARLGERAVGRLFLPYPDDGPVTIPLNDLASNADRTQAAAEVAVSHKTSRVLAALDKVLPPMRMSFTASNGWAVTGARTVSGRPILANDPHLGLRAPNVWYLARIDAPGLSVAGATAPGVPFHVLGHNAHIAWGMTTTGADTSDLVLEKLEPALPGSYLAPDGPRPFVIRKELIHVRGGKDVTFTVRETRDGPVISDLAGGLESDLPPNTVVSLRATMLMDDDRTAEALYRIDRAKNWTDFTKALARFGSPVQNMFYADTAGNIGFSVAGRIPVRSAGLPEGPVAGDDAKNDWDGFIPPDALPRTLNPEAGTIVNANNRVVGPDYPSPISRTWEFPYRAMRIEDLLAKSEKQSDETTRAIQLDVKSYAARDLVPALVRATPRRPDNKALLNRLAAWNDDITRDKGAPLLFHAWLNRLMARLFGDELGPLARGFTRVRPDLIAHVIEDDTSWCDEINTKVHEDCGDILAATLDDARNDLTARLGDPSLWRWDDLHRAKLRNLALDWLPVIGRFTRITIPTPGDDFTVNRGTSRGGLGKDAYDDVHGPSFRAIYDLADLDHSLFDMPGGQSGNPLSRHYRDLTTGWRNGKYLMLPRHSANIGDVLHLVPRAAP